MSLEFVMLPEFDRELKKLRKKYKTLDDDLENFKKILKASLPAPPGTFRIANLGKGVDDPIYKVKHFRCRALKGKGNRSGIRVIYAYEESIDKITFIEIYHKNMKENEDRERILKYFAGEK